MVLVNEGGPRCCPELLADGFNLVKSVVVTGLREGGVSEQFCATVVRATKRFAKERLYGKSGGFGQRHRTRKAGSARQQEHAF